MRYYSIQVSPNGVTVKTEYKSKEERDVAAPDQLSKLRKKWDFALVLKLDADKDGEVTIVSLVESNG